MWTNETSGDGGSYNKEPPLFFCVENEDVLIFLKEGYRNPTGFRRWVKVAQSCDLCYTCVMGIKKQTQAFVAVSYYFVCKYRKKLPMSKFACSVGNVSEEMLRKYIDNQG